MGGPLRGANNEAITVSSGALVTSLSGATSNIPTAGPLGAGVTTLNAVAGNSTGTTVNPLGIYTAASVVCVGTGTLAGTITLEYSVDGTTFVSSGTTVALTAGATVQASFQGKPFTHIRASLSGASGTGTATAKVLYGF